MNVRSLLSAALFLPVFFSGSPSGPLSAQTPPLLRGDADSSGSMDITDAIFILQRLFIGGTAPACDPIADADKSGVVDITDAITILQVLFLGLGTIEALTPDELFQCRGFDPAQVKRGAAVFETADARGNFFACSTCHLMVPDASSPVVLAGNTLFDALKRPTFKEGQRANFLAAANVCRTDWMVATAWNENSASFKDLVAYMGSVFSGDSAPALSYEIVTPAAQGPSAGDTAAGCELFNRSCSVCHGKNATGSDLAPSLVDIFIGDPIDPFLDDPDYLRRKVRLSGPPGTVYGNDLIGIVMPFWTKEKLADAQLEDLVAYMIKTREQVRAQTPAIECELPPPDLNVKVARRGELVDRASQGISGTVEELAARKIRLSHFNYSGLGILVRVWLYKTGDIGAGRAIGPDLRRQPGYAGETLDIDIPQDVTADLYNAVSIFDISTQASLGDAALAAP